MIEKTKRNIKKGQAGFTFVEAIMAVVIFGLLMGAVAGLIVISYQTESYTWQQSEAIYEARKGVEVMLREIRGGDFGEDGNYVIYTADNYEFGFHSDIDSDGEIEKVRYFLEGTDFKKGVIEAQGIPPAYPTSSEEIITISHYVRNSPPIFRYFDKDGQELPPPARKKDTKLIELFLVINIRPDRPPQDFELKAKAQLRNFKKEW